MLTLGFDNGATAIVDTGSMHHADKPRIQAFGAKAAYTKHGLDPQEEAMKRQAIDEAVEAEENYGKLTAKGETQIIPTHPGRWRNYYEAIGNQIAGSGPPPVRLEETQRVMAVFEAAKVSARANTVIRTDIPAID